MATNAHPRHFVSSTFSDLKAARNALQKLCVGMTDASRPPMASSPASAGCSRRTRRRPFATWGRRRGASEAALVPVMRDEGRLVQGGMRRRVVDHPSEAQEQPRAS